MKKNILTFLIIFSFSFNVSLAGLNSIKSLFAPSAPKKQAPVKLGPFAIGFEFCQKIQAISPILMAYSNIQWPMIAPGFSFGLVTNNSVLMKICDFLMQLEQLSTEGAIFAGARLLNDLTDKKWERDFQYADLTWNVANSIYDFRGDGGFRKGALTSASEHRSLVNYASKSKEYYGYKRGDDDPQGIETKADRRRALDELARKSYERSILAEATRCPVAKKKKNFSKEYSSKIEPEIEKKRDAKRNIRFIKLKLIDMGKDFISDLVLNNKYLLAVEDMVNNGYIYDATLQKSRVKVKKYTGKQDKEGKPIFADQYAKNSKVYQEVFVRYKPKPWSAFKNKYFPEWASYMKGQFLSSGIQGLLVDKKGIIEAKYRSYAYECSDKRLNSKINRNLDKRGALYASRMRIERDKCQKNLRRRRVSEKDTVSIMQVYFTELKTESKNYRESQAKIWTYESKYLGVLPIKNPESDKNRIKNIQAPKTSCRPAFTPGEMRKLSLEQKNVEMDIEQSIAKESMKQNVLLEAQAQADKSESEAVDDLLTAKMSQGEAASASSNVVVPTIIPGKK